MSAKKIADGLYVGGQESITQLGSLGVSRLLSLGMPPASGADAQPALEPDECLCIHLADEEDADLLSHLPLCCDFARHAASEGRSLLVACHAGVSRSSAVTVAILMDRSPELNADAALALMRREHPGADPNAGFMEQLRLFSSMGCRLNVKEPQYRRHRVTQLARDYANGDGSGGVNAAVNMNADPATAGECQLGAARCRKCSRLLVLSEHIIPHEHGAGARAFGVHKQRKGGLDNAAAVACSSLFVEPIAWMRDAMHDGSVSGKLSCPKCSGRLGAFNWSGEQCSCGSWVTPAFQLHIGRVDVLPFK